MISLRPQRIVKRDGEIVPYDRDRIATAIFKAACALEAPDRQRADALAARVEREAVALYGPHSAPTVEEIQDLVEKALMEEGLAEIARAYIVYRHERARARAARQAASLEVVDHIPYKIIYEVLRWNMAHGCESLDGLNRIMTGGTYPELIAACEQRYDSEVREAARQLLERDPRVRLVIIAGPSSSGKTTSLLKLSEHLASEGRALVSMNLDHYFFALENHPCDEFGDYDYETPAALDLELINDHIWRLLEGQAIRTPHYDFRTGKRSLEVHPLHLEDHQVLLIDSLHGLYGPLTAGIAAEQMFRVYVETLGQVRNAEGIFMRWADNRLMRRMIRDSWHRNLQPMETLTHWHYVRRSELRYIIPFIRTVDFVLNSAMPYELPLLKQRVFRFFPEGAQRFRGDPHRQDAYIRAKRVIDFLAPLAEEAPEADVPERSLLREFLGGSAYRY